MPLILLYAHTPKQSLHGCLIGVRSETIAIQFSFSGPGGIEPPRSESCELGKIWKSLPLRLRALYCLASHDEMAVWINQIVKPKYNYLQYGMKETIFVSAIASSSSCIMASRL